MESQNTPAKGLRNPVLAEDLPGDGTCLQILENDEIIRSPYEIKTWVPRSPDRLGGLPGWVQVAKFPVWITGQPRMKFLTQFDCEAAYYAYICPDCRISAVVCQHD